jgi:hypothetical protein
MGVFINSLPIISVIKSSRLSWAQYTRCMTTESLLENSNGREHMENLGTDGRISLKWILEKKDIKRWAEFNRSDRSNGRVL